jgi:hypothetical protein
VSERASHAVPRLGLLTFVPNVSPNMVGGGVGFFGVGGGSAGGWRWIGTGGEKRFAGAVVRRGRERRRRERLARLGQLGERAEGTNWAVGL